MTTTVGAGDRLSAVSRTDIEDFLYLEAELLDEWDLQSWLALYTSDAHYVVPCTNDPDGDPSRDLVLIDDNRLRMEARVERLGSRKAHREYPHSNTQHMVTNVRVRPPEGDELPVRASFAVWRYRGGRATNYVGKYEYRLVWTEEEGLRIRSKRVVLDMTALRPVFDVAIIL